jgi:hypothetical protein
MLSTGKPTTIHEWIAAHSEARTKQLRSNMIGVADQMTTLLKKHEGNPKKLLAALESFEMREGKDANAIAQAAGESMFLMLALGSAKVGLIRQTNGKLSAATGAFNVYTRSQLIADPSKIIKPRDAIRLISEAGLTGGIDLETYIAETQSWGITSVYLTGDSMRNEVKRLLLQQLGDQGITAETVTTDVLGRIDYAAFLKRWNEVGLPSLSDNRIKTIFGQNMSTAFSAGNWAGLENEAHREIVVGLRYISAMLPTTRPDHAQWHETVHPVDSTFWDRWYPPNDFNCYCDVLEVYGDTPEGKNIEKSDKWVGRDPGARVPTYETKSGRVYDFNFNPGKLLSQGKVETVIQ